MLKSVKRWRGETGKSMKNSSPVFFSCLDLQWVVALGKWSGTDGRRKYGGMWVEGWKEMGNSTTILNFQRAKRRELRKEGREPGVQGRKRESEVWTVLSPPAPYHVIVFFTVSI